MHGIDRGCMYLCFFLKKKEIDRGISCRWESVYNSASLCVADDKKDTTTVGIYLVIFELQRMLLLKDQLIEDVAFFIFFLRETLLSLSIL